MTDHDSRAAAAVPIVGIGASAGGVEALLRLFEALPDDLGLAYVVVLHLAPNRESELPEILRRRTEMRVIQVSDHDKLELAANHVYVIAPNHKLEVTESAVGASSLAQPRGQRATIDLFFRSLARSHGDGFAVVLSGTGSDGALGARAIKEAGGLVLVQAPSEAAYDGMPRAVIATGAADVVAPIKELAANLAELARSKQRVSKLLSPLEGEIQLEEDESAALRRVLELMRSRTGHDFSKYKRHAVLRRLGRRMQLTHSASIAEYLTRLREHPEEARRLFDALLITVTTFFRDPEAWDAVAANVVAPLVELAGADEQIRAWVPGCATGEEAFTLAMLFEEEFARRRVHGSLVIFASDIDDTALNVAREGLFSNAIRADVSEARLERFFHAEDDHYRINREIRDRIVFANHSLLRDPPFSRLHLISCRNLLIYLDRELQEQVMGVFRYACREDGFFFLGAAESVDTELFSPVDKKHRIFTIAKPMFGGRRPLPDLLATPRGSPHLLGVEHRLPARQPAAEAHAEALEVVAPPSLIVDERWNVLHLSPQAARFLQQGAGPLARRVTDLVRVELRDELHASLHGAFERAEPVLSRFVAVAFDGTARRVAALVQRCPQKAGAQSRALVTFLDAGPAGETGDVPAEKPPDALVRSLREELRRLEQHADRLRDDHIVTNEDLRAANEELQSLNEEYRSTTEELETSKEELQSINEELQTVNHELNVKLEEVSRARADVENLMAATDVGILFLDSNLCVKRFTPRLAEFFNLKTRDLERPIGDVTHSLDYVTLEADARLVLSGQTSIEREATSRDGRWYIVRMTLYRAADAAASGVVVTFVDVTPIKRAEFALRDSERRLENELMIVRRLHDMTAVAATTPKLKDALDEILRAALDLHRADFGTIQLLDHEQQLLRIHAQRGFGEVYLKAFECVTSDEGSAPARAFRTREACRIEDVARDPRYLPYREIAAQAGYRAVQSIPLIDRNGILVGVLSTHFRTAHAFSDRDRQLGDLLARQAADLVASRAQQEDLARLNRELLDRTDELGVQSRNKEDFLAMLGHELRNPMAAIVNAIDLVVAQDEQTNRALAVMRRQGRHMVRLVNDLLDITRINRGTLTLERKVIDAAQFVREAAEAIRPLLAGKRLELTVDAPPGPVPVHADPARFVQILDNLLRNAVDYTEHGRITVMVRKQGSDARIAVRDTGIGIDPAETKWLLEPFRQTERGRRAGGLGLGLTLVNRLVEMHGGVLGVHSEGVGTGSEFSFTISRVESMPPPAPEAVVTGPRPRRILVVDDQVDNAEMFAALLESVGQEARAAFDARAALEIACEFRPEVAFLDLSMPGLSGRELATRLRAAIPRSELTLIALTGFGKDHPDARDPQFAGHLLKPATMASVVELLSALDANRKAAN